MFYLEPDLFLIYNHQRPNLRVSSFYSFLISNDFFRLLHTFAQNHYTPFIQFKQMQGIPITTTKYGLSKQLERNKHEPI